jgi:toll-interacting protein
VNGGKQPRWNRDIRTQLPTGVRSISIEIYDECNFTMDELIAWGEVRIPDNVLCGETFQQWYSLSGKQGDGVEGMVELVMSFNNQTNLIQPQSMLVPNVGGGAPMPIFVAPTQPQVPQVMVQQQPQAQPVVRPMSQETLKQIHEMFPNMDQEVIKTVAEANGHNREATINSLLQMTN